MKRLIALTAGTVLSIFLVAAVYAAADKGAGTGQPATKGNAAVKSYYEKDKQRNENKLRGQKARQQQIDADAATKAQKTGK